LAIRFFRWPETGFLAWKLSLPLKPMLPPDAEVESPATRTPLGAELAQFATNCGEDRRLFQALIDAIPDPIFVKDCAGRYIVVNTADQQMLHAGDGDCTGRTVFDFPRLRENAEQYFADDMKVVQTGEAVVDREEPMQFPDGRRGWLLTNKYPMRDRDGRIVGLVGIARDITEARRARRELAETRQRLADHVENSPLAIIEWGPDLRVQRWAGQAETMFEWNASEVMGLHFTEFQLVHEEDCARFERVCQRLVDGCENRSIAHSRHFTRHGRTLHCTWQNSVLYDSAGRIISILSLVQDVTERILAEEASRRADAERQALERKLQESQKLESLGVLAGGIAHDFNNLLTGVLGNASLARATLPAASEVAVLLGEIETAASRAADLCKQMLAYSGKGRFVVKRLDLNALVDETAQLLKVSISKKAVLRFEFASDAPAVVGDPTQLRQVIMNLVINASEAIGDTSGYITLRTGLLRADAAYLQSTLLAHDPAPGDYVFIEVTDTGKGMSPDVQARIFEPFFTTKFTGRGLGLAAVLGIVRGHRGALKVSSDAGRGTTFHVLLPCAEGHADPTPAPAPGSAQWRGEGTVLIIDDEEAVRVSTARMLEFSGYRTLLAEDGFDGVEKFRSSPDPIALVLLDLTMPHMDGSEAFREITALQPNARVLLMSGYNEHDAIARFTGEGLAGFIQKPFTLHTLREHLREALA
jgi:PAS domain S-box-containing protein